MSQRARRLAAAVGLFAATLVLYAPVVGFDWVPLDDPAFVTDNPHVKAGLSARGVVWSLTASHGGNWMPLTWLSHMLDVSLFGLDAGGHHATSALLHALNAVLLFSWLFAATGAMGRSLAAGVLFAVHPLHVESAAWIAERKDVLSTAFGFAAILAYVRAVTGPSRSWRVASIVAMAASLASKPTLVTLPFALLLLDVWPLRRVGFSEPRAWLPLLREKWPHFALALAVSAITLGTQRAEGAMDWAGGLGLGARLANAVRSLGVYVGQSVWPHPLGAYYPHPHLLPETVAPASATWIVGLLLCGAAISVHAWRARSGAPYVLVGWSWFLGTLVPMLGVVQVGSQAHADRYMYVPLVGLLWVVCWGVPDALERLMGVTGGPGAGSAKRARALAAALAVAVAVVAAWLSAAQIQTWRNGETMLRQTLVASPRNPQMRYMLAARLWADARQDEAIAQVERALHVRPNFPEAHHRLGEFLLARGERERAIAHFEEALRQVPGAAVVEQSLARAREGSEAPPEACLEARRLRGTGDFETAGDQYLRCLEIDPGNVRALNDLGSLRAGAGRLDEAAQLYRRALSIDPAHRNARANLAKLEALLRDGRAVPAPPSAAGAP